ncbi:MAG TPA: lipoprotein insertase outer membrane protein LolB [Gallionella sp.]|nr:lipoprotein insertase outer membrane protein LolB [Gallionella sp.]
MRWLSLFWLVLVGGCALMPAAMPTARPAQPEATPFALNGRIAVRYDSTRQSAGLRWVHRPQSDEILLLAPLGQTAARIYRDATGARLESGEQYHEAEDVEALMQQVLGWHFPLAGMHYWVLGLAAPGSQAQIERDSEGRVEVLHQDGWEVQYLRYAGDRADSLPARLQLSRDKLQVQLLIDELEWNPQ